MRVGAQLLHEMARKGIPPDTQVFNAAISACEKGQQSEMALKLMRQMREMGCRPTAVTYGAAISACEKGQQWESALALLAQMPKDQVTPSQQPSAHHPRRVCHIARSPSLSHTDIRPRCAYHIVCCCLCLSSRFSG